MNRSFRGQESQQMQAAMKQRQQMGSLKSAMKEKEEELALFLEMRKCEKERNNLMLLQNSEEFDAPVGLKPGSSPVFNIASSAPAPARRNGAEDFLNSDDDKNDYDWLLTPPGTPLFPHLEMKQKTAMSQIGTLNARPTASKSRLASSQPEPVIRSNIVSRQHNSSAGLNTSTASIRRPSSSGGPGSRPGTPTGRPSQTATSKPSRSSTPTSRPTLPSTTKLPARSSTPTSRSTARSSTPTSRSTARSSTPTARSSTSTARSSTPTARSSTPTARSSTPTARSSTPTARSSTPTTRPSIPASKPTSRAATPTRRPSMPSTFSNISVVPVKQSSSSVSNSTSTSTPARPTLAPTTKPGPTSKNPVPARGTSPTVKSRSWMPSEMPGYSHDAPPNLRTSVPPDRPLSTSRGRPGAPSPRSSSVEPGPSGRPRRQSCSPSRGRPPNGIAYMSGSSVPAVNRHPKINDNVSPGLMGTKMVERVINMRRLMPPRQDEKHSPNLSGKSASSPDSSGFGRNLSKKSIDMAVRHMDIRRSIPGNLRPLMTNIPASSMYSVRSGSLRSRTISVSDSPLATSSNASSEVSVNNNGICLELEDDIVSERCVRSPASLRGR